MRSRGAIDRAVRALEALPSPPASPCAPDGMIEALDKQEAKLVAKGFYPMAPWWRQTFVKFYSTRKRRLVLRVGRRGGKSSSLCRIAVLEALHGDHQIPVGDTGIIPIVSVRRRDAEDRLRTIASILTALKVPFDQVGDEVRVVGRPIVFRVYVATIAAVSGFTSICIVCDEVAKWRDADTGANPAREVLTSLRPTMATMPNARMFLSSSPLGLYDAHAKAFEEGETEKQSVAHAPTWVANPSVTEEQTKADEPDTWKWEREYAAIPAEDAESGLLSATSLTAITLKGVTVLPRIPRHNYIATMDAATRGNAWTLIVATTTSAKVRQVVFAKEWRGNQNAPLDPDNVLREIASIVFEYGVDVVYSDDWSGDALTSIARRHRLRLLRHTYSGEAKLDAYEDLWRKVDDAQLSLLDIPEVRRDLLNVRRRITDSGVSIALATTPDGRHSDFAPAVCLAANMHCAAPILPLSETDSLQVAERKALSDAVKRFAPKKKRGYAMRNPWAER